MTKIKCGNYCDDYEFENRYKYKLSVNLTNSAIEDARKNYSRLTGKNLELMKSVKNRAQAMGEFDSFMTDLNFRAEEIRKEKAKGKKVIGTFCVQVPEELILAAGAIPIRLSCGFYDAIMAGEEIMPKNICPVVRASVGFPFLKIHPLFDLCDVIVIPTTCDAKKKMADVLSNMKEVWVLELPNNRVPLDAMERWQGQVALFKERLEKLTGKKIKRTLKSSISLLYNRTRITRRLLEIRKNKRIVINGRDFLLVMQSAFYDDIQRWISRVTHLCEELEANLSSGKTILPDGTPRIMLTGSPLVWPNFKVANIIETQDAVIGIDDLCTGSQYFYNPPEVTDWSLKSMLNAVANKYLLPTVCPVFVHNDDRVDRILELCSQYGVDGIIYHVIRLCEVMDFDFMKVNNVLRTKNMPILKIETEFGEEDSGQIRTRIEAFIEMMKSRRR